MNIHPQTKAFIKIHQDLILNGEWIKLYDLAVKNLNNGQTIQLTNILEKSLNTSMSGARQQILKQVITDYIYDNKHSVYDDRSHSWARVDYMLDGIHLVGFSWEYVKAFVLANQKDLGLVCTKLPEEFGWQGTNDYAFQWFNKDEYRKEYLQ